MIAILLGSHGNFAKEALASAQMIAGEQANVATFSLQEEMDLTMTITAAQEAFNALDDTAGVLILTDIMGGTPANVGAVLHKKNANTRLLTGFNLPTLIEALLSRATMDLEELTAHLKDQFPATMSDLS